MKNLIKILFVVLFFGCKSYESGIANNIFSIIPNSADIDIDKIFKQISPIQLKGNDLPLSVYRVLPHSTGFYILEGKKETVYNSDEKGNIIKIMKAVGDGPKELKEIWDMKVNLNNKELIILDRKMDKMLVFSSSLEFIEEVPIKKEFASTLLSFEFINGDEVLFHTSGSSGYKFLKYGLTSKKFEFEVPIEKEFEGLGFGNDRSMSVLNEQISVVYPLGNKIERYDRFLTRKEDLFFDFQGFSITESELKQIANDQNRMFDLIQNDENKKVHSFLLEETTKYYVLSYFLGSFRNGDFLKSIIEKSTGETKTFRTVKIGDVEVDLFLIGKGRGDELIFTINQEKLERMSDSQIQALSKIFKTPLDQNSPLLLFCTLK